MTADVEAQLRAAERMGCIGTLAASVAHDINNPLTIVIANLELVARHHPRGTSCPCADPIEQAREAATRVQHIVRDLRAFATPHDAHAVREPVNVRRAIDASLRMARNEIRHRARVVRAHTETRLVLASDVGLGQVLVNLLVNAAHAIPEGRVDANEIRVATRMDGDTVVIEISDTGCGIPADQLERVFEPFFTTKSPDMGTGLGLSICRRIVGELGGGIAIESEVGVGTTVRVRLPAASPGATVGADALPVAPACARARVLVIDDEPVVADLLARMLEAEHDVTALTSAREALDRIAAGASYDVIVCDLMMPELTGMDFHAELDPRHVPRVVFVTGGAFTARAREFLACVPNPCLDKPFGSEALRSLVASRLKPDA